MYQHIQLPRPPYPAITGCFDVSLRTRWSNLIKSRQCCIAGKQKQEVIAHSCYLVLLSCNQPPPPLHTHILITAWFPIATLLEGWHPQRQCHTSLMRSAGWVFFSGQLKESASLLKIPHMHSVIALMDKYKTDWHTCRKIDWLLACIPTVLFSPSACMVFCFQFDRQLPHSQSSFSFYYRCLPCLCKNTY